MKRSYGLFNVPLVYNATSDVRRLTDWSVVPAISNTDIETLSLKETDIHDVTAIRMAAKLAENVCTRMPSPEQKTFLKLEYRDIYSIFIYLKNKSL